MRDSYIEELNRIKRDPKIQRLRKYEQHKCSNTYEHVCHVARMSHKIEKKLHVNVDEKSMLRGAILHDYYLYDFRDNPVGAYEHGTKHAEIALENAEKEFQLNDIERDIIYSHMWPLNITHLPRTKEAWLVTAADKICAVQEMVFRKRNQND